MDAATIDDAAAALHCSTLLYSTVMEADVHIIIQSHLISLPAYCNSHRSSRSWARRTMRHSYFYIYLLFDYSFIEKDEDIKR